MCENQTFEKEGEIFFKNSRSKNIYCKYWNNDDYKERQPRALIFIVHGVGEHSGRYDRLAAELHSKLDAYIFSHDHHGHGKSDGHRVHTVDFAHYVNDIIEHVSIVRQTYVDPPLYFIGLSMGGTITVKTILDHPKLCDGVCMIAPALTINPRDAPAWKIMGVKAIAKLIPNLTVGTVGDKHMCHDKSERENYDNDPLNYHKGIKAGWAVQFYNTTLEMKKRYKEITLPVLTMHGDDDDVSPVEGSEQLHQNMAGGDLQEIKVIPGAYHCLHLEPNGVGQACVEDIVEFLQKLIKEQPRHVPRIEVNAATPTDDPATQKQQSPVTTATPSAAVVVAEKEEEEVKSTRKDSPPRDDAVEVAPVTDAAKIHSTAIQEVEQVNVDHSSEDHSPKQSPIVEEADVVAKTTEEKNEEKSVNDTSMKEEKN